MWEQVWCLVLAWGSNSYLASASHSKPRRDILSLSSWHQHWCHEESLQFLESEKEYDTQLCSEFFLKILKKEKGGKESDTKDFSNNFFFWFILKSVSFIKLLACERRRKEFFFLFFVGVTRSFLSIFQVQNLQIILKFYVFCALYIEYFCFLMSFIITVHSYPPSLINDRT